MRALKKLGRGKAGNWQEFWELQDNKISTGTELPAYSDTLWNSKTPHCKRVSLYPTIFSIRMSHFGPKALTVNERGLFFISANAHMAGLDPLPLLKLVEMPRGATVL